MPLSGTIISNTHLFQYIQFLDPSRFFTADDILALPSAEFYKTPSFVLGGTYGVQCPNSTPQSFPYPCKLKYHKSLTPSATVLSHTHTLWARQGASYTLLNSAILNTAKSRCLLCWNSVFLFTLFLLKMATKTHEKVHNQADIHRCRHACGSSVIFT